MLINAGRILNMMFKKEQADMNNNINHKLIQTPEEHLKAAIKMYEACKINSYIDSPEVFYWTCGGPTQKE